MKRLAFILTGLLLLIVFLIPSHIGASQSTRPDAAQITHFLNEHPLIAGSGAQVLDVTIQGEALVINLSQAVLPEGTYDEAIFTQLQADLNEAFNIDQLFLTTFKVEGELLEYWGRPIPDFNLTANRSEILTDKGEGPLSGVVVALSPGHGLYWNETYSTWMYQRAEFWGIREDTLNSEIMHYVQAALINQGATVIQLREFDKDARTGVTGYPAWYEDARQYAIWLGLPEAIWDGSNTNYNSDIRSRPYMANYYGADILISLHNNGWDGSLRGTETYWDTDNHPNSAALASAVHTSIVDTLTETYGSWTDRGTRASDSGYGEINYAQMAAILVELAFMDNVNDNALLHEESFKQLSANAITEGVCDFLGVTCLDTEIGLGKPALTPAYGDGVCDSGWYRYVNALEKYAYLALNVEDEAQSAHTAVWQTELPTNGEYKVEVFIPDHGSINWSCPELTLADDTGFATYAVEHANGISSIHLDQSSYADEWVQLGTFHFNEESGTTTAMVTLSDVTGETSQTTTVSASSMRFTLIGDSGVQFYDTAWVDDSWLTDEIDASADDIRDFLTFYGSCLDEPVIDVDAQEIDIPVLIQQAASANEISPKLLLAIMEAKQSALSTCPSQTALASLMGLEPASTAQAQIAAAAAQIQAAITALANDGQTPNGWITGTSKTTLDEVSVTPATNTISILFDYTQNAGVTWGGSTTDEEGVQGVYAAWEDYSLNRTVLGEVYQIFFPTVQ